MPKYDENYWTGNPAKDDVLVNLMQRAINTPDIHELQFYNEHLLFVWGNEKKGYFNHHHARLNEAKFLGEAITLTNNFIMKRNVSFPFVYRTTEDKGDSRLKRAVRGELYSVPLSTILFLDVFMSNRVDYLRCRDYVSCTAQDSVVKNDRKPIVEVWTYLCKKDFFNKITSTMCHGTSAKNSRDERWAWEWMDNKTRVS